MTWSFKNSRVEYKFLETRASKEINDTYMEEKNIYTTRDGCDDGAREFRVIQADGTSWTISDRGSSDHETFGQEAKNAFWYRMGCGSRRAERCPMGGPMLSRDCTLVCKSNIVCFAQSCLLPWWSCSCVIVQSECMIRLFFSVPILDRLGLSTEGLTPNS
jgi:hypothetical protein